MQNLRFNRYGDGSKGRGERYTVQKGEKTYTKFTPNTGSKDRDEFLKFRQEWRKGYKVLVDANRSAKRFIQENPAEFALTAEARRVIEQTKVMARSMMMALEAIKIQRDYDTKRNTSRLNPPVPVAMKVRTKYVPTDEEIEKRRQEKRERLAKFG